MDESQSGQKQEYASFAWEMSQAQDQDQDLDRRIEIVWDACLTIVKCKRRQANGQKKRQPMRSLINLWPPLSLQTHCEVSYWISGPGPLFLGLDCRTAVLAFESRPRKERTGLKEGAFRLERCCLCHQGNSRKSHEPR